MSGEKDLDQLKKEAAEKAKELAKKRLAENASQTKLKEKPEQKVANNDEDLAKAKAVAVAKAKAAAAAKAKAAAQAKTTEGESPAGDDAKAKAIAAAKAKAAAAAKAKAATQAGAGISADQPVSAENKKAQAIAAAKAKAAAAAKAKASAEAKSGEATLSPIEVKPSVNQPLLDKYVRVIEEHLGKDVLEDAYINKLSKDVPTLVAKCETYFKVAQFLKYNEQLGFDFLSELHGTDFVTHMEVYVHLYSFKNHQSVALKTKIDRNNPELESLYPLWYGVNWPECEAYDLLGIKFRGHPNLHRIMLGEDWVGHPLRKDYEPYDVEV
jgi:NADH-quinone oxidoreductase subunit C